MSHRSLSFLYLLLFFGFGRLCFSNEISGLRLNEEMDFLKSKSREVHTWSLPEIKKEKRKSRFEAKIGEKLKKKVETTVNTKLKKKAEATVDEKLKKKKIRPSAKKVKFGSDTISYNQSAIKREKVKNIKDPFLDTPINDYIPQEPTIRKRRTRSR
jgi:hypothetical protein